MKYNLCILSSTQTGEYLTGTFEKVRCPLKLNGLQAEWCPCHKMQIRGGKLPRPGNEVGDLSCITTLVCCFPLTADSDEEKTPAHLLEILNRNRQKYREAQKKRR